MLSTLHSRSVEDTLTRLESLHLDSQIVKDTLELIIAQRLVPTLCPNCKIRIEGSTHKRNELGCEQCRRGIGGRKAVFEWRRKEEKPSPKLKSQIEHLVLKGEVDASILDQY